MIEGTNVIEVGGALPVWHAGALLQALGADVARVSPKRELPILDVDRPSHAILNRGKAVIDADLRIEADRIRIVKRLKTADVLLLGVRPKTASEWGLGPEQLSTELPALVVARLSAFGSYGPCAQVAGHDLNATAITGLMAMEMAPGLVNGATPYETPVADLAAALFTVIGILAALRARDTRGGRAVSFETSLAQASLALVSAWAPASLSPHGLKRFRSPWYGVYRAGDGVQVAVGALEVWQQDWVIANALGGARPVHRAAVDQDIVAQMMRTRAARDWVRRAASAGVALSIVRQPESVLNDEQVAEILGAGLVPDHPWQRALVPFGPESFPGCVAVEPSEVRSRLLDQLES